MRHDFNKKAGEMFSKIEELTQKGMTPEEAQKIVASLIDTLAGCNLTYDQAHDVLEATRTALYVRSLMMTL